MACTSSQTQSTRSPASNSTPTRWDVFLSFRGSDTRYNFISHLHAALDRHGVRTFKDDPELRSGEVISEALLQAIQESRCYIVVLSENYASSPWCLDELVEIYNCHKKFLRIVIPVFYNIDASVVRHQLGSFKEAFGKHDFRFAREMEKVNKWRLTLKDVADLSGKCVSQNRSEADIVNEILDEILLEIDPKTLDVAKYPVGLDSRVKDITTLLSSGTEGVIRFGIYGMGGVGKTTLAKALYNQLLLGSFKDSCFLANCREVSGTTRGLVSLQQTLINDVLKSKNIVHIENIDEGIKLIRSRICSTKVLVVIDDLDHLKQFEYLVGPFAFGSIVIITTRNEEMLDKIEVEPRYRYRVNVLGYKESLALLNHHAFRNANPRNTLMDLCKHILHHAGGLPLALEVFGSYLYKQTEVGWESFIEKLQRIPDGSIQKRLIISLNALEAEDPMLKKMFLDIACFFIGKKKQEAIEVLETYYSYVDHSIDILKKRCLLTINRRDELRMHDLLRDMSRDVARNNFPYEPGKHSRLWVPKDICEVLMKRKGTEFVEVIIPCDFNYPCSLEEVSWTTDFNYPLSHEGVSCTTDFNYPFSLEGVSLTPETFKRLSKLRFLSLQSVNLAGNFEQTFEELRWLSWGFCPLTSLPSSFYPQKLVFLELSHSKVRTMQELDMVFENLRTLNMSHSRYLITIPNFTKFPSLETLNLEGCKSLEEVHISIGILVKLVFLNLCECVKLRSLPDSICNLSALEVLNIGYCKSIEALPTELGNIKSLRELHARCLTVSEIPDSIGRLSKLVQLVLSHNWYLEMLPDTICNLRALEILHLHNCVKLRTLPICFGNIRSLKELSASGLTVSELPNSIGRLSRLVKLELAENHNLKTLPDTIFSLRSLKILDITRCEKLEILPDGLWNLTTLRKLNACGTPLKILPEIESSRIGGSKLNELDLFGNALTALPYGISQFLNLRRLILGRSLSLLSIAELPPNLILIKAEGCTSLERLSDLSNLKQLKNLNIAECSSLREIQGLKKLTSLQQLHLIGCNSFLLACTLTERFFQIYCEYGHHIRIIHSEVPDWISKSSYEEGSTVSIDWQPDVPLNFLGLILCFKAATHIFINYSVRNTTSGFIWADTYFQVYHEPLMIIVPKSVFSFRDSDDRIEVNSSTEICGMHLLYKPEIKQYKRRKKLPLPGM